MRTHLDHPTLLVVSEPVGPFAMNQYLIVCRISGQAAIIDAGSEPQPWIRRAQLAEAKITTILQTHAHIDHVMGLPATHEALPGAPIWLHEDEAPVYQSIPMQARMFGLPSLELPPVDRHYRSDEPVTVGALSFEPHLLPGHSPGHVCLLLRAHNLLFGGDLVFAGSIGRTDLPGCDPEAMQQSLRRFLEFDDDLTVLPGHMGPTTVGRERRSNPFLRSLQLS
jgi:glyoxylase-like metal-dependent hydrolase (beta-lactamase superfamily II)